MISLGIGLLIGIALLGSLFAVLLFLFQEEHPILRLLFIGGILICGFFIPTAVYQLTTACDNVVSNTTISNNVTSYQYTQFCATTANTSTDTFYSIAWGMFRLILVYWIIHVIIMLATPVWEKLKKW